MRRMPRVLKVSFIPLKRIQISQQRLKISVGIDSAGSVLRGVLIAFRNMNVCSVALRRSHW